MKIGYSGTQFGMNSRQKENFVIRIIEYQDNQGITEFRHGDCEGGDSDAHDLIRKHFPYIKIIGHPPLNPAKRAFKQCDELRPEKDYIPRNHDIVDETDELIAAPKQSHEVLRSGTWSTIRYAKKSDKNVIMLWP